MEVFGAAIELKDNVSGVLKQAVKSSQSFRSELHKAKSELKKLDEQKLREKELRVQNSQAMKGIEAVRKKMQPITKKTAQIVAKTDRAMEKIRGVKKALGKVKENKVIHFAASGLKGIANGLKTVALTVGAAGAAIGFTAFVAGSTVAIKSAIRFESEMANVGTLLDGDVKGKISSLGASLKKVSVDTGISTSNLSGGLYEVISAFGESVDNVKQLEVAAKAAKAGNAETADSVRMLSAVTKGYGDTSAEAVQKASDLAFMTVKLGQTSFPELASSMGSVIPLASTLKVSQEELFGAMSTLTGVTGNTAEVSTQLRATLQGFLQPSSDMKKALQKIGYSSGAAALESEGLNGILTKLKSSVNGDEVAFSSLFSSVEAKNAVLALAGTQAENFTQKTEAMYVAMGATDRAFKQQTGSVKEMAAKLRNFGVVMLTSVGEKALPVLLSAMERAVSYMPKMEEAISSGMAKMEPLFSSVASMVEAAVDRIGPTIQSMMPYISDTVTQITDIVSVAAPVIATIGDGLLSVFSHVFPVVAQIASDMRDKVGNAFTVMGNHTGLLQQIFETAGPAIANTLSTAWSVISPLLDLAIAGLNLLASVVGRVFPYIQSTITSCWQVIKPVVEAIGNGISTVANAANAAANAISGVGGSGKPPAKVGSNATGTSYWRGGYTTINEHGPELVELPAGSKVYSNSTSKQMMGDGKAVQINMYGTVIREEADVDRVADELYRKLKDASDNK